jgi:hypothetical protein
VARKTDRFRQAFDRHGRVGVHFAIAGAVRALCGFEQLLRLLEASHDAVQAVSVLKRFSHRNTR